MNYTIRWKDTSKYEHVEKHLAEKIQVFDEFDFITGDVKAEIARHKEGKYEVHMNVHAVQKGTLVGEAHSDSPIKAVNEAVDKILDQIRRVKTQFEKK